MWDGGINIKKETFPHLRQAELLVIVDHELETHFTAQDSIKTVAGSRLWRGISRRGPLSTRHLSTFKCLLHGEGVFQ
jgi:hypothetical protein